MLKSVLTLLLSKFFKKTDLDFIIGQVMPDGWNRRTVIKDATMGSFTGNYTAPTSGYFCISGGNGILVIAIQSSVHSRIQVNESGLLQWPCVYIPVNKGATFDYQITASTTQTNGSTVFFVPSIGATDS
jgi:hypothetical protein|nr:MAG TPA: hypothetical protein [Caudoviricetes sp.]